MSLASPHSVEGICHKSVALSAHFSKEKSTRACVIEELGLCQSKILLAREAVLNLPCSLIFAVKALILLILDKEETLLD